MEVHSRFSNPKKDFIRNEILQLVRDVNPQKFISLPHLNFKVEQSVQGSVTCVERDKTIWTQQRQLGLPFDFKFGKLSQYVDSSFDFGWLDFCGIYTSEVTHCLKNSNFNNMVITFCAARDTLADRESFYPHYLSSHGYFPYKAIKYRVTVPMIVYFCGREPCSLNIFQI